ncbi:MAG: hypothetical protein ACLU99_08690 [Alphaproteobacteria bacterium]
MSTTAAKFSETASLTQQLEHKIYGGVVPEASRSFPIWNTLTTFWKKLLKQRQLLKPSDVDAQCSPRLPAPDSSVA